MQETARLPNHKAAVARSFNRAASTYNEAAFLEKEVGERLLDRLDFIKQEPRSILDLGSGTGFFSEKLLRRYPNATFFNLDLAEGMLRHAYTRHFSNIITLCGDAEALPLANNSIDFIFSNCVFHWSCDLSQLFEEIHRVLKPEGLLLFSTLGPDTLKELRESFYLIDTEPHVNNFMDMHLVGDALLQAEFLDPVMDMEQLVLTFPNLFRLLEDIKKSGSSYVLRETAPGLGSKSVFKRLSDSYNQFKLETGQTPATVEIVYGHAWSNPNRQFLKKSPLNGDEDHLYHIPLSKITRS